MNLNLSGVLSLRNFLQRGLLWQCVHGIGESGDRFYDATAVTEFLGTGWKFLNSAINVGRVSIKLLKSQDGNISRICWNKNRNY